MFAHSDVFGLTKIFSHFKLSILEKKLLRKIWLKTLIQKWISRGLKTIFLTGDFDTSSFSSYPPPTTCVIQCVKHFGNTGIVASFGNTALTYRGTDRKETGVNDNDNDNYHFRYRLLRVNTPFNPISLKLIWKIRSYEYCDLNKYFSTNGNS
jgi:hypothetical protein